MTSAASERPLEKVMRGRRSRGQRQNRSGPQQRRDRPKPQVTKTANEPAQLNVLISGGFAGAYGQLLPEFMRASGINVTTGSGASQGAGPQTIAA